MTGPRVKQPECFAGGADAFERTLKLYHDGNLPASIEGQMLVVPILRMLRGVYGTSNFGVALCLLWHAIGGAWLSVWTGLQMRFGLVPPEIKAALDSLDKEPEEGVIEPWELL
jgi:hypothetical protein